MTKSISVKRKKRGRPATGVDPFVGIRLPEALIEQIERYRVRVGATSRSEAIRALIERGLAKN